MSANAPILEFDSDPVGVFDPGQQSLDTDVPGCAVACHFVDLVSQASDSAETVMALPSGTPMLRVRRDDQWIGLYYPGQGAPLAAASTERVIAAGCANIVACGDAGSLVGQALGELVIVNAALRDEGTSYHYLPPSREVSVPRRDVAVLVEVSKNSNWDHTVGKTWTTDGLFRETKGKIDPRRDEGCLVVEMEAAALMAVALFRGVRFGQYLYAGDDINGSEWQDRGRLQASRVRQRLLALAFVLPNN